MITIIAGTNRKESNTKKVALEYQRILKARGIETQLLALDDISMHDILVKGRQFEMLENEILIPTQKFILIIPEYHGSYPGALKLLIDSCNVKDVWWHKKALLTGVSTGRAGNLRGMEHLTGSLLHIKVTVHSNRLPLSAIDKLLDDAGRFTDEDTVKNIQIQLEEFIRF